jgi:hypothetical protein
MTAECRTPPHPSNAPHVPAAFINAIAEEGTKAEAIEWLQKTWNELCQAESKVRGLERKVAEEQDAAMMAGSQNSALRLQLRDAEERAKTTRSENLSIKVAVSLLNRWHSQGMISTGGEDEMPPLLMKETVEFIKAHCQEKAHVG